MSRRQDVAQRRARDVHVRLDSRAELPVALAQKQRQLDAHLRWRGENRACFEQAIGQGQLLPDTNAERAAITLVALVGGLIDEWVMAPESFNLLEVGQAAVEDFLACLAGPGQPKLPPLSDAERARLGQVAVCPLRPRPAEV